jgi:tetrapyrrole methylase family protein/MazG family protein/ATP diphosphatase
MPKPPPPVVPEALEEQRGEAFSSLVSIMRTLLSPEGCPWDREQTFESLRKFVLEEACEVIDAIDQNDRESLREELGDLLLQVVFQAELARIEGRFGPDDVIKAICDKLVRRHPHVYADASSENPEEVLRSWERIKATEKHKKTLLEGVPKSLPALVRAQRVGDKVHRVGFDWPNVQGSRDKVTEELAELDHAIATKDQKAIEEEMGDVLFALVNLSRHLHLDAEACLRATCNKFIRRFTHVEEQVLNHHGGFADVANGRLEPTLETLDRYWNEAKSFEKA